MYDKTLPKYEQEFDTFVSLATDLKVRQYIWPSGTREQCVFMVKIVFWFSQNIIDWNFFCWTEHKAMTFPPKDPVAK